MAANDQEIIGNCMPINKEFMKITMHWRWSIYILTVCTRQTLD